MNKEISYKPTVIACYIGNLTQAIVINLLPIIFIPLREQFGLSYGQFGALVLINFIAQVVSDIAFSKAIDKFGFRPFVTGANVLCVIGFVLFILSPIIFPSNVFVGFVIGTIIFSSSGGLLELTLSPIIDAIPTDEKEKAMAMLHSFYAWGQVAVVVFTTLGIYIGLKWWIIMLAWTIVPFCNLFFFLKVPLATKVREDKMMKIRDLIKKPIFIIAFFAIMFGGAAEVTMAQWTSSFMQKGMNLPKIVGDMLGMCGFAIMLGIGRLIYGLIGEKLNLHKVLIYGSLTAVVCYIVVALSPFAWLSVVACALTGICVSLLWPGTLVVASKKLPLAGASMFALLSAGGDLGASLGSWLTGVVTDYALTFNNVIEGLTTEQFALRIGVAVATIFPLLAFVFNVVLRKLAKKADNQKLF